MTYPYKAVLMDADDTIFDFGAGNRRAVDTLMDEIGYHHPDRFDQYQEINHACWAALEKGEMTQAELQLREDMFTIVSLLKERYPEFHNCSIAASGVNAGIRETYRIQGLYTLTGDNLRENKRFACAVGKCTHPMDIHKAESSQQTLVRLPHAPEIPHRALILQGVRNLVAAGRCISADREAFASLRVQGTLMSVGEGAGILAALACREECDVADVPENALRRELQNRQLVL